MHVWRPFGVVLVWCWMSAAAHAETPAPSLYWGALDYPDQRSVWQSGLTMNRFTEFNSEGSPYPSTVRETIGFNFATTTWTERLGAWGLNVTAGAGPTADQPTAFFQNDFVHNFLLGVDDVPVGETRDAFDFMAGASVTRWLPLFDEPDRAFISLGAASGTLYHEPFVRFGAHRLPAPIPSFVRSSAMGRYGQLYNSSVFPSIAAQSYTGQVSVSLGDYWRNRTPKWELEVGATISSGLFVDESGNSVEEIFWTLALRFPHGRFEIWNDAINGKDRGPTFGATVLIDLGPLLE